MSLSQILCMGEGPPPPPPVSGGSGKHPASRLDGLKAMVVEDQLFVALSIETHLESFGLDVVGIASNGAQALRECHEHDPDIVVMDINLGEGIDGLEAARLMQAEGSHSIIFVSAYADADMRRRIGVAVPGARLLGKPVTAAELEAAIRDMLGSAH